MSEPWMDDEVLSSLAIRSEGWAREAFRRIQSQADEIERLRKELWLWAQAAGEEF